jgi:hypothetical protein
VRCWLVPNAVKEGAKDAKATKKSLDLGERRSDVNAGALSEAAVSATI